jgi:hypothetical protein
MLSLTPLEIHDALQALDQVTTTPTRQESGNPSFLAAKLASSQHQTTSFELSEDEVELLLDLLPAPTQVSVVSAQTQIYHSTLRGSLLDFLSRLRG